MSAEQWVKKRVDEIIRSGLITQGEWREILERVWEDGEDSPVEAEQMSRLLDAMNDGRVVTTR